MSAGGDDFTVAFWFKRDGTQSNNTLWASEDGSCQIYNSSSNEIRARYNNASTGGATASVTIADDTWYHVNCQLGPNISGTLDVILDVTLATTGTHDQADLNSTSGTDAITGSGGEIHYALGDDAGGSASDDGFGGKMFDLCVASGLHARTDMNFESTSNGWDELSSSALSNLIYRIDGQNVSDAGEDSSGNGHDFTVESGGVTLSLADLPPGANPATGSDIDFATSDFASATELAQSTITGDFEFATSDLASATAIDQPSVTGDFSLSVAELSVATEIEQSTITTSVVFATSDFASATAIDQPGVTGEFGFATSDLQSATELAQSTITIDAAFATSDFAVSTEIEQPSFDVDGSVSFAAADFAVSTEIAASALTIDASFDAPSITVATSVDRPAITHPKGEARDTHDGKPRARIDENTARAYDDAAKEADRRETERQEALRAAVSRAFERHIDEPQPTPKAVSKARPALRREIRSILAADGVKASAKVINAQIRAREMALRLRLDDEDDADFLLMAVA